LTVLWPIKHRGYRWIRLAVLLACLCIAPAVQSAEPQSGSEAEQWRSVTSAEGEDVPGVPLLIAAYALFGICVASYIVRLVRLQQRSRQRIERLAAVMDDERAMSQLVEAHGASP
jgi:hypothetical protein